MFPTAFEPRGIRGFAQGSAAFHLVSCRQGESQGVREEGGQWTRPMGMKVKLKLYPLCVYLCQRDFHQQLVVAWIVCSPPAKRVWLQIILLYSSSLLIGQGFFFFFLLTLNHTYHLHTSAFFFFFNSIHKSLLMDCLLIPEFERQPS